ncbi:Rhamnogalacturonate lyase family protein [Hirschfeldia incana]|nr:Rhamnogalacturonate lyase family protein [Hirschfeldia incana]
MVEYNIMPLFNDVVMKNGIVEVTISKPDGFVTGISYHGVNNLLESHNEDYDRGYWDLVWSEYGTPGTTGNSERIKGKSFEVVVENEELVEISFTRKWDSSLQDHIAPINVDKRFIMRKDVTGFYSYGIFEHLAEWPAFNLPQTRIVYKLRKDKFRYMAVADNRQRKMPLPEDRLGKRGRPLAYPEAVLLVHPVEEEFKGEVDDKYEYSCENKDLKVHGWISHSLGLGCWQIIPSNEFRSGGLVKQNLTSHVGPISLAMFISAHYAGEDMVMKVKAGESWKKVFGPVFTYFNCLPDQTSDPLTLWQDAKSQMLIEVQSWPYGFPASEDFALPDKRGCISGRLLVRDKLLSDELLPANGAFIGLAPPGGVGSWQTESKGYQFWTEADADGYFTINNIREGDYNLNAYVTGWIGDYQFDQLINITAGCDIDVSNIVYEPPRDGPTVWEIGVPDRSAAEFFIPDPNPKYINKLYIGHPDRFRQYGLWERYTEIYPEADLVFTIGVSDYKKDWFFAHVTRKTGDDTYEKTTWQIKFKLEKVQQNSTYKLRIALATANVAELQVRMNEDESEKSLIFTTGVIGHDNTIARHGIHGLYRLYNVDVPSEKFVEGDNTLFLTQAMTTLGAFNGLMYDYIRLEEPCLASNFH